MHYDEDLVFDLKTAKGVSEMFAYYYSSMMGQLTDMSITSGRSFDIASLVALGPRGYDLDTLVEPYSSTPTILTWFATILFDLKSEQAARPVEEAMTEEEESATASAKMIFNQIFDWFVKYVNPKAVYNDVVAKDAYFEDITSENWVRFLEELDSYYPGFIETLNEIPNSVRIPSFSTVITKSFSKKMRTNILLKAMLLSQRSGASMFEDHTEAISETRKWLTAAFRMDPKHGLTSVIPKVDVGVLFGYIYRVLLSFGDPDEIVREYKESAGENPTEEVKMEIELTVNAITEKYSAFKDIAFLLSSNAVSFDNLGPGTLTFVLSLRPSEKNSAFGAYMWVKERFIVAYNRNLTWRRKDDDDDQIDIASGALAANVNFNMDEDIIDMLSEVHGMSILSSYRMSITRYLNGIVDVISRNGFVKDPNKPLTITTLIGELTDYAESISDVINNTKESTDIRDMAAARGRSLTLLTIQKYLESVKKVKGRVESNAFVAPFKLRF